MKTDAELGLLSASNDVTFGRACLMKRQDSIQIFGHFIFDGFLSKNFAECQNVLVKDSDCGFVFSFFIFVFGSIGDVPMSDSVVCRLFVPMSWTRIIR